MSLGPLEVFPGELSVQVVCPFFNWVVCLPGVQLCEFFTYFGDQAVVWGILGKYVFPYCWFSFNLIVFFGHAEAFYFDEVPFVYSFLYVPLGDMSVRMLLCGMSEIFLPMFSSRTFMVLPYLCTPMFIAAQFTIAKYCKQPKCPSANEWTQKLWYIYTLEFYAAERRSLYPLQQHGWNWRALC